MGVYVFECQRLGSQVFKTRTTNLGGEIAHGRENLLGSILYRECPHYICITLTLPNELEQRLRLIDWGQGGATHTSLRVELYLL